MIRPSGVFRYPYIHIQTNDLSANQKGETMNKDTVKGKMKMFIGQVDLLTGKVQERYGIAKEEASKQVKKWADKIKGALNA